MSRPTREEQRLLVKQWEETGRILEQLRDEKLRGKPYDWEEVDALLSLAENYDGPPRLTSGLQEQQRLFMKLAPDWYKKLRGIE
jgi:hypothetical protein